MQIFCHATGGQPILLSEMKGYLVSCYALGTNPLPLLRWWGIKCRMLEHYESVPEAESEEALWEHHRIIVALDMAIHFPLEV